MLNEVLTERQDGVLTVTINRPDARNTITFTVLDRLLEVFTEADRDPLIRAIVVTGAGDCFSYGTDLAAGRGGFEADSASYKPLRGGRRDVGGELALRIFASTKPVIAAVNGTAVGIGITMILPMDVRIAADTARFGLPFARRGIIPESCATWFLPRIVGIATAVDWAMTGRIFPAEEAMERGLVREVVAPQDVLPRAQELAADIAAHTSPVSVALTRQLLWRQLGSPHPMSANRLESQALLALVTMGDAKEGVAAFKEKRAPVFPSVVPRDLPSFYPWFEDGPFES